MAEPSTGGDSSGEESPGSSWGQEDVLKMYPLIQAFIISRLGQEAGADVVQETLKDILKGIDGVRAEDLAGFRGWCYRIAKHKINDFLRIKYAKRMTPMEPEELLKMVKEGDEGAETNPGLQSDLQFLMKLLRHAHFPCDELLRFRHLLGLSNKEIAKIYEMTEAAIHMKIRRCYDDASAMVRKLS